jgi:hypothetical protein
LVAGAMLADTVAAVARSSAARRVLVFDGDASRWAPEGFEVVPQRGSDHAQRIAAAFEDIGGPALLIGMDTPQISPGLLDESLGALLSHRVDAVLGRTRDGGWWGMGLRHPDRRVVEGVPMSTPVTAERQLERLAEVGLRCRRLPTVADVDTIEDARRVAAGVPLSCFGLALHALLEPASMR